MLKLIFITHFNKQKCAGKPQQIVIFSTNFIVSETIMKEIEKVLEKIRIERFKKGYLQYYMGSQLEMSQRAYGMIENGNTELKVKVLIKIIAVLELDSTEVFIK